VFARIGSVRQEEGIGLVELVIAMTMLVIGIFAVASLFASAMVVSRRASETMTALTLAESKLETFRSMRYGQIGIDPSAFAAADSTYIADSAYSSAHNVDVSGSSFAPTEIVTGADHRSYRVDTYIVWQAVTATRSLKQVTVVVQSGSGAARPLARVASRIDASSA
jgi:Tfp pilus assembly protein PilV